MSAAYIFVSVSVCVQGFPDLTRCRGGYTAAQTLLLMRSRGMASRHAFSLVVPGCTMQRLMRCVGRIQIHPWTIWLFWSSPLMYAMEALSVNEFTAGLQTIQLLPLEPARTCQCCSACKHYPVALGMPFAGCHPGQLPAESLSEC